MLEIEFEMNVPRNEIRLASNGIEFFEYQGGTAVANNNKTTQSTPVELSPHQPNHSFNFEMNDRRLDRANQSNHRVSG